MESAQLIVCERAGRLAAALRRELAGRPVRIRTAPSLADCDRMIDRWPASLVLLEVRSSNLAGALAWLARLDQHSPLARAVAWAADDLARGEWALREAGALDVVRSLRHVQPVAELAVRHLARAPAGEKSATQAIMDRLPWND